MQRLIMTAAAVALLSGAIVAATSARAEMNYGPMKNGTQCYKASKTWGEMGYGYWTSCPNQAAAPAANQTTAPAANQPVAPATPGRTAHHVRRQAKGA
jgi:hypothetical protein